MSKNTGTLYDHNVYQKQEYKVLRLTRVIANQYYRLRSRSYRLQRVKNDRNASAVRIYRFYTREICQNQGQHPTGVELIKPNQDEFQDFLDMVDPIIKNAKGSSDGEPDIDELLKTEKTLNLDLFDIPDPDKDDMLSRKFSTGTLSPMPKHYGEV